MSDYDREQVEALLELYFDPDRCYGLVVDTVPDGDMPKGTTSKAETGGWMAELVDIGRAWDGAGLTVTEKRRLLLYHGLGFTYDDAAEVEGASPQAVAQACSKGIERILAFLNGEGGKV